MNDETRSKAIDVAAQVVAALAVATILGGVGAWVAARDAIGELRNADALIATRLEHVEREFIDFRKPGDRFTATDGRHIQQQIDGISQTVLGLGERCQRCANRLERIEAELEYLQKHHYDR